MVTYNQLQNVKLQANEELLAAIGKYCDAGLPAYDAIDVLASTLAGTLHRAIAPGTEDNAFKAVDELIRDAMTRMISSYGPCDGELVIHGIAQTTHDERRAVHDKQQR